jgi:hypothetical protein
VPSSHHLGAGNTHERPFRRRHGDMVRRASFHTCTDPSCDPPPVMTVPDTRTCQRMGNLVEENVAYLSGRIERGKVA